MGEYPRYRDLWFTKPLMLDSTKNALWAIVRADSGAAVYVNDADGAIYGVRCGPEYSPDIADVAGRESANVRFGMYRPDIDALVGDTTPTS